MRARPPKAGHRRQNQGGSPGFRPRAPSPTGPGAPATTAGKIHGHVPSPSVARHLLLYGTHPVTAAWLNPERMCRHLYGLAGAMEAFAPVIAEATRAGLKRPAPIILDRDALDRLTPQNS